MRSESAIRYSVVVPFYNEQEKIPALYMKIMEVMDTIGEPYEMVFVDDGSKDHSYSVLSEIYEYDRRVQVVRLRRNFGQTSALKAGFDLASGDVVISMGGDLQDDPNEIPRFVEKIEEGFDLVSGWRAQRRSRPLRRLPGKIANWIMAKISGIDLNDFGGTYKAYRREILEEIQLCGDLHCSLAALASSTGARVAEIRVTTLKREVRTGREGVQKIGRALRLILDLMIVKFLLDHSMQKGRFFGLVGVGGVGLSGMLALFLLVEKFYSQKSAFSEHGPLAYLAVALFITGVQCFAIGVLGEIIASYHDSQNKPIYALREVKSHRKEAGDSTERQWPSTDR
jgi:glycosyltransferase involved in cell wall biosynthesis